MFDGLSDRAMVPSEPADPKQRPGFGVQPGGFGFTISWATNASVVVEAATNLANPVWIPVSTNTLTGGTNYFSDPQWTNYPDAVLSSRARVHRGRNADRAPCR